MSTIYKYTIVFLICILSASPALYGQQEPVMVTIDTMEVNLAEVDIKRGKVLRETQTYELTEHSADSVYVVRKTVVYVSPSLSHYLVLEDVSIYDGYDGTTSTNLSYYDIKGQRMFTNTFLASATAFISYSGNYVILEIVSTVLDYTLILDKDGNKIREIQGQEKAVHEISRNKHKTILLNYSYQNSNYTDVNYITILNEFEIIDIPFACPMASITTMSNNEMYFAVLCNDSISVYDNTGNFYWKLIKKKNNSVILSSNREEYYIKRTNNDTLIEIRDFDTHAIFNTINSYQYPAISKTSYRFGFVSDSSNDFYLSSYNGEERLFYFFNKDGDLINETAIPLKEMDYIYKFKFDKNVYIIEQ